MLRITSIYCVAILFVLASCNNNTTYETAIDSYVTDFESKANAERASVGLPNIAVSYTVVGEPIAIKENLIIVNVDIPEDDDPRIDALYLLKQNNNWKVICSTNEAISHFELNSTRYCETQYLLQTGNNISGNIDYDLREKKEKILIEIQKEFPNLPKEHISGVIDLEIENDLEPLCEQQCESTCIFIVKKDIAIRDTSITCTCYCNDLDYSVFASEENSRSSID